MECRALKAVEEENQSCDPVVVAQLDFPSDLIPYYQNTPRKHNTTNPLFDYTMIFDKKSVTAGDAEHAVLTLKVKDSILLSDAAGRAPCTPTVPRSGQDKPMPSGVSVTVSGEGLQRAAAWCAPSLRRPAQPARRP